MPRPLGDEQASLDARLKSAQRLLLLTDFDGTLTPIVNHPGDAGLAPADRELLEEVHRLPNCFVAVISGRSLADIRSRIGLIDLFYAGNHGFEIAGPGFEYAPLELQEYRPTLLELLDRVRAMVTPVVGAILEDKGITASVHVRNADVAGREHISRELARLIEQSHQFELSRGKLVHEIRPKMDWHKGRAGQWLINYLGRPAPLAVCLGDDCTDEDAFRALTDHVTVRVGFDPDSAAKYFVESPKEANQFIRRVIELRR